MLCNFTGMEKRAMNGGADAGGRADSWGGVQVLVTGATGFTGSVLTRKLVERGARVRAITRRDPPESLRELPVEWIRGQVFDPQTVREAADGAEYVFHIAAAYRTAGIPDEMYGLVHVTSTKLLVEAVSRNPGFKRFVHVSTVGVHGHIDDPPADESYRFAPGDVYQKTKAEAELWLRENAPRFGVPFTVIRPAAIMGPDDTRLLKLFKMAKRGIFPLLGFGKCLYHLIHVEDLCEAMLIAAVHPAAEGEVFIIGNLEPISLEEMGRLIARTLGRPFVPFRIPAAPVFAAAAACEAVCRVLGKEPPLHRRRVAFYTKDRAFNVSKMRNRLGFTPRYDNERGIVETARAYVAKGWL
ncbi:MAG: NAD-dependent epimerase/dehydratase family protein [Kiritimatiellae bacterium]|nr:NAD-dependent epimerase/dehydratase family protein [Kiritimatiellia bacterium]MDW8457734.1 NAD-dependent epimerase/dehydratase family protein [Verrucomicrobiota bacterium]